MNPEADTTLHPTPADGALEEGPGPRAGVANAPVSYGAFEITIGKNPHVPDATELLALVAGAGYAGIDLGPIDYLGSGPELAERLVSRGLGLAGGYLQLAFSDPGRLTEQMSELDALLDVFDATAPHSRAPFPTLADAGSEQRELHPGRAHERCTGRTVVAAAVPPADRPTRARRDRPSRARRDRSRHRERS